MSTTGGRPVGPGSDGSRWWTLGALALAGIAFAFAYRALFTLGPRYDVTTGVEYWLFVPNDRAPVIVLALAAWLAYRRWPRLRELPEGAAPLGWILAAFGLGASMYMWAVRVRAEDLQAISLMFNASGLLMLRWGLRGVRAMWLPIAFLGFCVPIPAPLLVTVLWELRLWTADYTGWLLYLLGVPALVSGDQILRASESFQVIEGCSGLRSAETLTMLVVLLIDLFHRRGLHAALLLVSAPTVALALNGVRVLTLTLNPHSEIVAIHSLQGVAILLVGLLVVYAFDGLLASAWRRWGRPRTSDPGGNRRESAAGRQIPQVALLAVYLAVGVFTAGAALWVPPWAESRPRRALVAAVDEALTGQPYEDLEEGIYFHGRTHFRESVHRSYTGKGAPIELFAGSADLRDRRTSIVSWITAVPGSGWSVRDSREIHFEPGGRTGLQLVVEKGTRRRLSNHQLIGVGPLWRETLRSLFGLDRSDFRRRNGQLALRLSTPMDGSRLTGHEKAEERLRRIYEVVLPALLGVTDRPDAN